MMSDTKLNSTKYNNKPPELELDLVIAMRVAKVAMNSAAQHLEIWLCLTERRLLSILHKKNKICSLKVSKLQNNDFSK